MLVRAENDVVLVIGQLSHAWVSGQLARAWGNERFPAPAPREPIALGAEQHDVGWARFDLAPRLNPDTGLPRSFLELTVDEHLAIWRDAPDALLSQSAHAALVASMHGRSLSELRARMAPEQEPQLASHIEAERERQERLCAALAISSDEADRTRRQMWTWDGLSLALCLGWQPFTARDVPSVSGLEDLELREVDGGGRVLEPWPFAADSVCVCCEGRSLGGRYDDEAELRRAYAQAPPVQLTFTLSAAV
jgi:hypothetical protein